jgi:hypothetical protein
MARVFIAAALVVLAAPLVRAQEAETAERVEWSVATGYGFPVHLNRGNSNEHVVLIAPSYAIRLSERLDYVLEGHIGLYTSPGGYMLGFMPFDFRFYVLTGETRPYITVAAGVGWTNLDRLIEIDTHFNFLLQPAVGIRGKLHDGQSWSFEARFNHISNSGVKLPNLGLNTVVFLFGWHYR